MISAKEFFSRRIKTDNLISHTKHIEDAIKFIREEYGIEATKEEFLIEYKSWNQKTNVNGLWKKHDELIIKPSQSLLRKFAVMYPEMVI